MKRLTEKVNGGFAVKGACADVDCGGKCEMCSVNSVIERLGYFEELYEQGRLLIKPEPLEATCGSCQHFVREKMGKSAGICDCRKRRNRYGNVIGDTLFVYESRKRCRDDYKEIVKDDR